MTLTPDKWEAVKDLFEAALGESPSSRSSFLRERCGDISVCAEVERLLGEHEEAGAFLSVAVLESLNLERATGKSPQRLSAGELLSGRFRIVSFLASGGMGEVYKAEDTRLDRTVALKFLSAEFAKDEQSVAHFRSEAMAASALNHPNICTVYDFGEDSGRAFIAMEYLDGETLADHLKRGPCPVDEVIKVALEVSSALCAAHHKGIIHGDLKPGNLMLTETGTKLLDFGLANKSEPVRSGEELTLGSIDEGRILGTLPYMSPERLHGQAIDAHGDIFAFGAVLYEMLTGEKAFKKNSSAETIASINQEEPKSIHALVRNVPKELERIAWRCLRKNPRERYLSMADVQQELQHLHQIFGASGSGINIRLLLRKSRRLKVAVPALLVITILISLAALWIHHNSRMMWARNQAVPEIARLIEEEKPGEAYTLAVEAERYIPHDPALMKSWPDISWLGAIDTTPAGVTVYRRNYGDPGAAWEFVGRTPIEKHRFPLVDSLWRFELQGFDTVQRATFPAGPLKVTMDRTGQAPPGMVRIDLVPPNAATTPVGLFGLAGYDRSLPAALSNYWIDRFEVTNRDFKRFVDAGGYKNSRYWKYKFRKDGRTLPWQDAVKLFRDSTGRPGPATWSSGQYPQGQDDYPVAGVSWFEAAAYAEFAGKMLPTIYHWKAAASPVSGQSILPLSNFGGKGPAPVGTYQGISWSGTYDMAGNAKEWVFNEDITGKRYILGGAWNEPTYLFFQADARSPFDRSPNFGFRCAKYTLNGDESKAANPVFAQVEDYNTEKPASDQLFKAYKGLFSYDKAPLNSVVEPLGETQDWREEKITLDAAYGNERIIAFLFLPKKASPPYQTVIHFTGATAFYERSSANLNQDYLRDLDFIVKSGRAVMFVMFKGMFERWDNFFSFPKSSSFYRDHVVDWSKDLGRSIDYLETRPDIDSSRLAYEGVSMGAALGALLPALESRLKVLVLISPGFYLQKRLPEANQLNFAPHVKIPVLMLNGQYDYIFPVGLSQEPLYREIGTPASQKRRVVYDCGHDIPLSGEIKESLNWLDQYLGPVRPH